MLGANSGKWTWLGFRNEVFVVRGMRFCLVISTEKLRSFLRLFYLLSSCGIVTCTRIYKQLYGKNGLVSI